MIQCLKADFVFLFIWRSAFQNKNRAKKNLRNEMESERRIEKLWTQINRYNKITCKCMKDISMKQLMRRTNALRRGQENRIKKRRSILSWLKIFRTLCQQSESNCIQPMNDVKWIECKHNFHFPLHFIYLRSYFSIIRLLFLILPYIQHSPSSELNVYEK